MLTFTNILNKVLGLFFRIPISNLLGDSGMAYFNAAYHIYVWFYMISTGGLPLAVSMLISEARFKGNTQEIDRIFKITIRLFLIVGTIGTILMIVFSKAFAFMNGVSDSYISIIAIAPTLFLVCVSSSMRGYFQGFQEMRPTAISQIMESAGKLIIGVVFARYAMANEYSLPVVAAYAITGLTIGTACGMFFLFLSKIRFNEEAYCAEFAQNRKEKSEQEYHSARNIINRILYIAIPITLSASVMSLTTMIDDMIINWRLMSIGFSADSANALYGNYTGFAVPFADLPPALIYPIAYSLIPLLKGTLTLGDKKRSVQICKHSLKVTALIAIPCTIGVCVFAEPLLKLLYNADSAKLAAPKLSILAISIFFICMLSVTNAILQAHGKQKLPLISLLIGSVVKLVLSFVLIGIPQIGIYGAPISTVVCYIIVTSCNVYFMAKHTGITPAVFRTFWGPLISSIIGVGAAFGVFCALSSVLSPKLVTIIAVMVTAVIYFTVLCLIKGIDEDDVRMLPKGDKIFEFMRKMRLIRV